MPAITVLLPAWNAEATLERAVESVLTQTEADFELLVVDDGSTDGTASLAEAIARRDDRVRVLRLPHAGIVPALNAGLDLAQGHYVARMDADDECMPIRLAAQRAWLDAHPDVGVVSCLVAHEAAADRETTGYALYVDWLNSLVTPDAIALNRFVESPVAHPSVMFRRELAIRHGAYAEGDFPEDYELWLRWMEVGVRFAKVPETLLVWHDPPGRLSRTHPAYAPEAFDGLKARYLARWLAAHNPRHPEIIAWGAGKTSRRRVRRLQAQGIAVSAFVDIDPKRRGRLAYDRPILGPDDLTGPDQGFVVALVGKRGAGALIRGWLSEKGFHEGEHFVLGA